MLLDPHQEQLFKPSHISQQEENVAYVQEELFIHNPATGTEYIQPDANQENGVVAGEHVDVRERAIHLVFALNALSEMSKRSGLQRHICTEIGIDDLHDKYGANTEKVVEGNRLKLDEKRRVFKSEFGKAFGLRELIDGGNISTDGAKCMMNDERAKFERTYADAMGKSRRDKFKDQLENNLKSMEEK